MIQAHLKACGIGGTLAKDRRGIEVAIRRLDLATGGRTRARVD